MSEGEPVATAETCPDCGSPLVTACNPNDVILKMFGQGQTFFECGHCGNVWTNGELITKFGSTEENDYYQKQCYVEHGRSWERLDTFTNDGWSTTAYWCPFCGKYRYEVQAVVK